MEARDHMHHVKDMKAICRKLVARDNGQHSTNNIKYLLLNYLGYIRMFIEWSAKKIILFKIIIEYYIYYSKILR